MEQISLFGDKEKSTDWKLTFTEDFDFCGSSVTYICGMSVPPVMTKRIVQRIIKTGVFE